ncbi:MAG: hypothetical protein IJ766_02065 [Clostridia bacterium]|nr:hypothetical protein [Clostridia bacterium]
MKKILYIVFAAMLCVGLLCLSAAAADANSNGISDRIEQAVENSPEISSLVDAANNGVAGARDNLLNALQNIDGLDLNVFLQGLEGLDENDGLLGKLASLIGPNSDGLSGILARLGGLFPSNGGSLLEGLGNIGNLGGLGDLFNGNSATEAPTVHTTAASATQVVSPVTAYTPSYNYSATPYTPSYNAGSVNLNQYTVPYVPATTLPVEVTTQAYTAPVNDVPAATVAVAMPVNEGQTQNQAQKSTNWKKIVGAVLVFGSFAGIAAVVIKKSM